MPSFRDNARGIGAMMVASFCFIGNDTLVKVASDELPIGQIIFIRGLFGCAILAGLLVAFGQHRFWRGMFNRPVWLRTVGEVGGTLTYLPALFHMPIANSTTILQIVPLTATAGAAFFLGERVGWRRWAAIVIGFLGVLIVVRPGFAGFDAYSLLVLVAVLFVTLRDLSTRAISASVPTLLVTALAMASLTFAGAVVGVAEDWALPSAATLAQLAGSAALLCVGFAAIILAMRSGEMSVVAPFRYANIVWAILLGFLVWGDRPDLVTLLGTAIIIGAGVYTFYRERKLSSGEHVDGLAAAARPATLRES